MHTITTIGLDIAKSVFQVHGIDAQGKVIIRLQLEAPLCTGALPEVPPCLLGIEACAPVIIVAPNSRLLGIRLLPPAYAKPYGMLAVLSR